MNEIIETHSGSWILVAGSHALRSTMLALIARLAENGSVRILDGGNQFNAYKIARTLRGQRSFLERITVSRMFTCYQVLASLEKTPALSSPFIVLDFLNTFYDETVQFQERRRLIEGCIPHLERLSKYSGGAVSIHPPAVASPEADELFFALKAAAPETWIEKTPAPILEPWRLF